jgi:fatty acid desaturase
VADPVAGPWSVPFRLAPGVPHGGPVGKVTDHRVDGRRVWMSPGSRFICRNMNHHVGHPKFPIVPHRRLPDLHARITADPPAPAPVTIAGYRGMWPSLVRQLKNDDYLLRRDPPATARPCRDARHTAAHGAAPAERGQHALD